jgi:hypothetical protein
MTLVVKPSTGVVAFSGGGATRHLPSTSRRSIRLRASSYSRIDIAAIVPEGRRRRHRWCERDICCNLHRCHPYPEHDLSPKPRRLPSSSPHCLAAVLRKKLLSLCTEHLDDTLTHTPSTALTTSTSTSAITVQKGYHLHESPVEAFASAFRLGGYVSIVAMNVRGCYRW